MAKLYYQQPGKEYVPKKSQKPMLWFWRRLAIWSVIINVAAIGLLIWMAYG